MLSELTVGKDRSFDGKALPKAQTLVICVRRREYLNHLSVIKFSVF